MQEITDNSLFSINLQWLTSTIIYEFGIESLSGKITIKLYFVTYC